MSTECSLPKKWKSKKGLSCFFGVSSTVVRAARSLGFGNTGPGFLDSVAQDLQLFLAEEYFLYVLMIGCGRTFLDILVHGLLLV